jgi:Mn-dependent DtxR family transcriptional regulator
MAKRKVKKMRHLSDGVVPFRDICSELHMSKKDVEEAMKELADNGLLDFANENGVVKYSLFAPKGAERNG